jgi:hypothetical protein
VRQHHEARVEIDSVHRFGFILFIERSLAGVGSTRPEELRELRRRQLSIERDSVRAQLKLVGASRERLEAAIRTADNQAYQQSTEQTAPALIKCWEHIMWAGIPGWWEWSEVSSQFWE